MPRADTRSLFLQGLWLCWALVAAPAPSRPPWCGWKSAEPLLFTVSQLDSLGGLRFEMPAGLATTLRTRARARRLQEQEQPTLYKVDWGDGTQSTCPDLGAGGKCEHTYPAPGTYNVVVTGVVPDWAMTPAWRERNPTGMVVERIVQWGGLRLARTGGQHFYRARGLQGLPALSRLQDAELVRNWSYSFAELPGLVLNMSGLRVRDAEDLTGMLAWSPRLIPDVRGWETSRVTSLALAFAGSGAGEISGLNKLNLPSARNFSGSFLNASKLRITGSLPWNMSQATDVSYMFAGIDTFDANVISSWSGMNISRAKTDGLVEGVARLSGNLSQILCRPGYFWKRARYTLVQREQPAGRPVVESEGWKLTASCADGAAATTTPGVDSRASDVLGEYLELMSSGSQARRVGLRSLALYPFQPAGADGALSFLSEIHIVGSRDDGGRSWNTVYKAAPAPDFSQGWNITAGPGNDAVIGSAFYSRFRFIFPAAYQRAAAGTGCTTQAALGHLELSLLEQEESCNGFESTKTPTPTPTPSPSLQVTQPVTTTTTTTTTTSAPVTLRTTTATTSTSTTSTTTVSMTPSVTRTPAVITLVSPTPSGQVTPPVTTSRSLTPSGSPNVDYCALPNNGGCGPNGVCNNTPGSAGLDCTCAPGYVRAGAQELTWPHYMYGWQVQVSGTSLVQQQASDAVDGLASTPWNSSSDYGQSSSSASNGVCNFPANSLAPVTVAANEVSYAGAYVNFNQTWGSSARLVSVSVISTPAFVTPYMEGGCTNNASCPSHSAVSELVVLGSSNGGTSWTYLAKSPAAWSSWAPEQTKTLTLDQSPPTSYNAYRFVILRNFHSYSISNFRCSSAAVFGDLRVTLDVPSCELPSQSPSLSLSLSLTSSPTRSASASRTTSSSLTTSATLSPTVSLTPTCSSTPSSSPSLYSSRSNTPTQSLTSSRTGSVTLSPSITPSPDVNECSRPDNGGCGANGACTNTPSSFYCTCNVGFIQAGAKALVSPDGLYGWTVSVSSASAGSANAVADGAATTYWSSTSGQYGTTLVGSTCTNTASASSPVTVASGNNYAGAYVTFTQSTGNSAPLLSVAVTATTNTFTPTGLGSCTQSSPGCPVYQAVSELVVLGSSDLGNNWTYLASNPAAWSDWFFGTTQTLTLNLPRAYNAYRFVALRNYIKFNGSSIACPSIVTLGDLSVTLDVPLCELPTQTPTPTRSLTSSLSVTPTKSATPTPTGTPTQTATPTGTPTQTTTPTRSPSVTPTLTRTQTPTKTSTPTPSSTSTSSLTPSPTPQIDECTAWTSACDQALETTELTSNILTTASATYILSASSGIVHGSEAYAAFRYSPYDDGWRCEYGKYLSGSGIYNGNVNTAGIPGEYIQVQISVPRVITQFVMQIPTIYLAPRNFTLLASSNSGTSWTTLLHRPAMSWSAAGARQRFVIDQPGPYNIYRLVMSKGSNNPYVGITRLWLREWCCPSCANVPSNSYNCTCAASAAWFGGGLGQGCYQQNECNMWPTDGDCNRINRAFYSNWFTSLTYKSWTISQSGSSAFLWALVGAYTGASRWASDNLYDVATGAYLGAKNSAGIAGEWVQLSHSFERVITSYSFGCRQTSNVSGVCAGTPVGFALLGGYDLVNWHILSQQTNSPPLWLGHEKTVVIDNPAMYSHYRFVITQIQPGASGTATVDDLFFNEWCCSGCTKRAGNPYQCSRCGEPAGVGCTFDDPCSCAWPRTPCSSHKKPFGLADSSGWPSYQCPASFSSPGLYASPGSLAGQTGNPLKRGSTAGGACNYNFHVCRLPTDYNLQIDPVLVRNSQQYFVAAGGCEGLGQTNFSGLHGVGPNGSTALCTELTTSLGAAGRYFAPQAYGFNFLPTVRWKSEGTVNQSRLVNKSNYLVDGVMCCKD